jgi:hypothetical protein
MKNKFGVVVLVALASLFRADAIPPPRRQAIRLRLSRHKQQFGVHPQAQINNAFGVECQNLSGGGYGSHRFFV